jgi:hypothetical protein
MRPSLSALLVGLAVAVPADAQENPPAKKTPDYLKMTVEARGKILAFESNFILIVETEPEKPRLAYLDVGGDGELRDRLEAFEKKRTTVVVTGRLVSAVARDHPPEPSNRRFGAWRAVDFPIEAVVDQVQVRAVE